MGTGASTHLVFQSDEAGTDDDNAILLFDGVSYYSISVSDIMDAPYDFLQPDMIYSEQAWYYN